MMADVVITDVKITPNPVNAGRQFIISVEIKNIRFVIGDGAALVDGDGSMLLTQETEA